MASTVTRNSDSGVRFAVEEASGYALVLNQFFSHTRQMRPRKVLKSLTLFKFVPDSTAHPHDRMKLTQGIRTIGRVLITGGYQSGIVSTASAWLYQPQATE